MLKQNCPLCNNYAKQVKAGLKNGRQQYKCTSCGRRYVEDRKKNTYPPDIKLRAMELHKEGYTLKHIGETLNVTPRTIC